MARQHRKDIPTRWWAAAAALLGLLSLGVAGIDASDWLRFLSGTGGVLALWGGVFFAFSSMTVMALAIRALLKSLRGEPRPTTWMAAMFGPERSRSGH